MNEPGKSDRPVVPTRPANAGGASTSFWDLFERAQRAEGRGLAKENEGRADNEVDVLLHAGPAKQADRTQRRVGEGDPLGEGLPSALDRVRRAARRDRTARFTSLWHHVYDVDRLREAYLALRRTSR